MLLLVHQKVTKLQDIHLLEIEIEPEIVAEAYSNKRPGSPVTPPPAKPSRLTTSPVSGRPVYRTKLLKSVGVTRKQQLTSKARKLYRIATNLKKIAKRLDFQNVQNKERLSLATQFAESPEFLATKLNKRSLNFIWSQLKMQKKSPRGRRYTFEDKTFALSLFKQGPMAYRVLRKTFALPSRKTLTTLLSRVPFNVGINPKIMGILKEAVNKLDPLNRYCVLLFDELSLEPSLTYIKKSDSIVGFEDIGTSKSLKFADHALVFMIKGLKKKWKQPISFYFTQGGMEANDIKHILESTIEALQEAGFTVVATVCDQFSANTNAIRQLVKKREKDHGESELQLFKVKDQEIVAIYDPPHLLKGIRNNFVNSDVKFTMDNVEKGAKWSDIQKLYELDVGDSNTKMCYKLTPAHIYKDQLRKMKVKFAAQVLSHRVSSTLRWTVKHEFSIHTHVKNINRVLKGQVIPRESTITDPLKRLALDRYKKNKLKKSSVNKIKQLQ